MVIPRYLVEALVFLIQSLLLPSLSLSLPLSLSLFLSRESRDVLQLSLYHLAEIVHAERERVRERVRERERGRDSGIVPAT